MLSIIIPHKNSIRLLERALLSAPISESVEIIVVDDHSHTSERANVLAPAFPSVIFLNNRNANRGAGAARNMGLEHSKGEWIIFLDADDYFEPGFINKIVSHLRNPSEADCVYFRARTASVQDEASYRERHLALDRAITRFISNKDDSLLRYGTFPPWGKAVKSSLLKQYDIRFEESLYSNDVMFSVSLGYYAKSFDVFDICGYVVTCTVGSLSETLSTDAARIRLKVARGANGFLLSKGVYHYRLPWVGYLKTAILKGVTFDVAFATLVLTYYSILRTVVICFKKTVSKSL